ncbi:UPF0481 protein At3g47200-like, partial [Gossypium arboreum]|uniref:UPF0481 protein At3g47200-like n=1 Tax=Gossypium arboreum TaxID=29729 RepID=UPI0022F1C742
WWWEQQEGERIHLLNLLRVRLRFKKEKPWWWPSWLFTEDGFTNEAKTKRHHSHTISNVKELKETVITSKTGCLPGISFNHTFFGNKLCSNEARTKRHHTIGNVKELKKAGIRLKASETSCLTDISFNSIFVFGKLRLPPINVNDSTMNLIAYEMCPDFDNDFTVTSYMCFLDLLIDEAEDVKDLRDAGILYNRLGSDEEVAKLFNKMNTDLVPSPKNYSGVKRKIHNHCKNMWINHAVQGYHTYFTSPWTFLAFVGAIAALSLSTLQTYFAMHQLK